MNYKTRYGYLGTKTKWNGISNWLASNYGHLVRGKDAVSKINNLIIGFLGEEAVYKKGKFLEDPSADKVSARFSEFKQYVKALNT